MCVEDIIIARASVKRQRTVTVALTDGELVGADADRVSLLISAPSANTLILSFGTAAAAAVGIRLSAGDPALLLTVRDHGEIVVGAIRALMTVAGVDITVWETILQQERMYGLLRQFDTRRSVR